MATTAATSILLLLQSILLLCLPARRRRALHRERLDWDSHAERLLDEGEFESYYRMSYHAFLHLVDTLEPTLQVDEHQSRRRTGTGPITPKLKVHMCIRWMCGASFHDVRTFTGVSKTAFFDCVHEVIDALLEEPSLQLKFPVGESELRRSARAFSRLSNQEMITGCVGAIDGWLCPIETPTIEEADRPTAFFSGHYQTYGLNVQACCDHLSRFTAISCESAGGTGDALAYLRWGMSTAADQFPPGLYLVGDNAYSNDNNLLTPFPRPKITTPFRDSYNFHISQLRIRVEMAFGLLVKKWRIFRAPLEVSLERAPRVIEAGFILHNYCINQRLLDDPDYIIEEDEDLSAQLPPIHEREAVVRLQDRTVATDDASQYRQQYMIADIEAESASSSQWVRDAVVERLERNNVLRPHYNMQRQLQQRQSDVEAITI